MMCTIGKLAAQQTVGTFTKHVVDKIIQFLNYTAMHPNTKIQYCDSRIDVHVDTDTSYLIIKNTRSWVG